MSLLQQIISKLPVVKLIEKHYSFSEEELLFLAGRKSDFNEISMNEQIKWTPELIEKLKDDLVWPYFTVNESVPWKQINMQHANRIFWPFASINPAFAWNMELLEKGKENIDWNELSYQDFPFTPEMLHRFRDWWDWKYLSGNSALPWSEELIERFKNWWNWDSLSMNAAIPFSAALLEKYKKYWVSKFFDCNAKLLSDEYLPLLKSYTELDFISVSLFKSDFTPQFLETYRDKLDWHYISENINLLGRNELLEQFSEKWRYHSMSSNPNVPWTYEFIFKHENKWNWNGENKNGTYCTFNLSGNEGLPWSFDFIELFYDRLGWGHLRDYDFGNDDKLVIKGVTSITKLHWTAEKIVQYMHRFDELFVLKNKRFYDALETEVGKDNIFNLYRSLK